VGEDRELLERLRSGDETAFDELIRRYHTRLVRFARTFVANQQSAEDVVQDTWVAVIRGMERFEARSSLQTWIYRICVNRARSRGLADHRFVTIDPTQATVDPARFGGHGDWAEPLEPWTHVDDRLFAQAIAPVVRTAIDSLPEGQRQVVTLRDVDGLTSSQTCEVLGLTETHQRVLLHRARARLRTAIEAEQRGN
jgi:RNA polymerase sigma-70 factor, ECF subfamily